MSKVCGRSYCCSVFVSDDDGTINIVLLVIVYHHHHLYRCTWRRRLLRATRLKDLLRAARERRSCLFVAFSTTPTLRPGRPIVNCHPLYLTDQRLLADRPTLGISSSSCSWEFVSLSLYLNLYNTKSSAAADRQHVSCARLSRLAH